MTFRAFAAEWDAKHLVRVRASTAKRYRELLAHQLRPVFGDRLLSEITVAAVEAFVAEAVQSGRLAPKTVNHALALLKQLLTTAADWGYLAASPLSKVRKLRLPRRALPIWTFAELRRFLLAAPAEWLPVWIVKVFAGLRPGEAQAMPWQDANWPDFAANKIHVTTSYEARTKVLGAPKTDRSIRDVDMVPTVRRVLETLPSRAAGGLVFPGAGGAMYGRSTMRRAWAQTIIATKVRPISPYALRHTFASLLIAAGKNPLYIARQMGHYSAGFTLEAYGHLMDSPPRTQVEWIDDLIFPEGFEAAVARHSPCPRPALTTPLFGASAGGSGVQSSATDEELKPAPDVAFSHFVQPDAAGCMVEAAGIEPAS
ncbi:MAG TPA: tyrosine-type recombinase/integrase [bacterium]|nr:tyrosine-type recombinase/integrase [bacterium]